MVTRASGMRGLFLPFALLMAGCGLAGSPRCSFDPAQVALDFKKPIRDQQAVHDELQSRYSGARPNETATTNDRQIDAIGEDAWGLRFALQEFLPIGSYPRAIYGWDRRLAEKDVEMSPDSGRQDRLKAVFLQTMFELSPGSHIAASDYTHEVTKLWALTTADEWDTGNQGVEPPAFPTIVEQLRATQKSYGSFGKALSDTVNHPDYDDTFERVATSQC
ncbi:hypothetical protein JI743_05610 [Sphingopyxis sp. DHUNG17]|uniref:hypothetical protein n=1 Tax=Sphingopyxis jiangsuensis TaxID=2871171 RepID=UPI00191E4A72|nr:hypothetical protein [Sphingopyxis lutea]MBL0768276.1 hypothetical protein [Sphingopyxis lutea]